MKNYLTSKEEEREENDEKKTGSVFNTTKIFEKIFVQQIFDVGIRLLHVNISIGWLRVKSYAANLLVIPGALCMLSALNLVSRYLTY